MAYKRFAVGVLAAMATVVGSFSPPASASTTDGFKDVTSPQTSAPAACGSGFATSALLGGVADTSRVLQGAPASVKSKLIENDGTASSGAVQVVLEQAASDGVVAGPDVAALSNPAGLQFVGRAALFGRRIVSTFNHVARCGGFKVELRRVDDAVAVDLSDSKTGARTPFGWIAAPWAMDSTGASLPTHYEINGSRLSQIVDTAGAVGAVFFDPSYSYLTCSTYSSKRTAPEYIDIDPSDNPPCAIPAMLWASRHYYAVFGYDSGVARQYGKVVVRQDGECSTPGVAVDSASNVYDFSIPCRAHDFCYDLIRAGFGGTVKQAHCDNNLRKLMDAHCAAKGLLAATLCQYASDTYYYAVSVFGQQPAQQLGRLTLKNVNSLKCMDVKDGQPDNPVQQFGCQASNANQEWQIVPIAAAEGFYSIYNQNTFSCLGEYYVTNMNTGQYGENYLASGCNFGNNAAFYIAPVNSINRYTFRPLNWPNKDRCVTVPNASFSDSIQLVSTVCAEVPRDTWLIEPAENQ